MKDLSRNIEMNCPVCANNQFEYDTELESPEFRYTESNYLTNIYKKMSK